jgi:hypothetical protein
VAELLLALLFEKEFKANHHWRENKNGQIFIFFFINTHLKISEYAQVFSWLI